MNTISLCMIVKNEEAVLGRCLDSVRDLVDEIVIVDTGSTDATKLIAGQYTDKVFDFVWIDDFSAARNYAFDRADMDYCMWLDADDVMLEADRELFRAMRENLLPGADVVMMKYNTAFDAGGVPTFSYYRERVVRNAPAWRWLGAVHEAIVPSGKVVYSDAAVTHRKLAPGDPDRNLRIFEAQLAKGAVLDPRGQFYYARELYYHQRYEEAIRAFTGFLDEGRGWIENNIDACRLLSTCYSCTGQERLALRALLRSLEYDRPRAEACCDIGNWFFRQETWEKAVFWYETALGCQRNDASGAFVSPDCYGFLPCIQLCVCWYHLGDKEKARTFNDRAGQFKPDAPAYLYNKELFEREEIDGIS